ncbi:hypothetical protein [Sphingomonas sp. BAUL-RG-20F-R05-02]|uniref:hypothetical protein n=1 Tax=Sphingomonas sp. BAUL-RG-20F-R05-02 TaxID=2914830 RepID=UPI001F58D3E2|nr:hypothetical protein [Sphingomonas sp. BAUL-RG-20F-R05-02]
MAAKSKSPKPAARKTNAPKPERTRSSATIGLAAGAVAVLGGLAAAFRFGTFDRLIAKASRTANEHAAPDLAPTKPHNDGSARAPEAFRPDPTAPVSAAERDAFRPATVPVGGTPDKHTDAVH